MRKLCCPRTQLAVCSPHPRSVVLGCTCCNLLRCSSFSFTAGKWCPWQSPPAVQSGEPGLAMVGLPGGISTSLCTLPAARRASLTPSGTLVRAEPCFGAACVGFAACPAAGASIAMQQWVLLLPSRTRRCAAAVLRRRDVAGLSCSRDRCTVACSHQNPLLTAFPPPTRPKLQAPKWPPR